MQSAAEEGPRAVAVLARNHVLLDQPALDLSDVLLEVYRPVSTHHTRLNREPKSLLTFMLARELAQVLERLDGLLVPVLAEQPQRALVQEEAAEEQYAGGDDLHGHGDAPAGGAGGVHVLVDAVVDPEADERADLVRDLEEAREDAADGRDGELGDVAGHGGGDGAAGEAGQGTAGVFFRGSAR